MQTEYRVVAQNHYTPFENQLNGLAHEGFRVIHFQLGVEEPTGLDAQMTEKDVFPLYVVVMERQVAASDE